MKENIFQFGDTFWIQLMGCAIRTSAIVNYSYTYISLLKMSGLLEKYSKYLLFYKQFINNIHDSKAKYDKFFKKLIKWWKTMLNYHWLWQQMNLYGLEYQHPREKTPLQNLPKQAQPLSIYSNSLRTFNGLPTNGILSGTTYHQ